MQCVHQVNWRYALVIGFVTGTLTGLSVFLLCNNDERFVVNGSPGDYVAIRHAFHKDQSKKFEPSPSTLERSTWEMHYTITDDRWITNQWYTVVGDGHEYKVVIEDGQQIITDVNTGEVTVEEGSPVGDLHYSPAEPISGKLAEMGLELVRQEQRHGRNVDVWEGGGEYLGYPDFKSRPTRTVYFVDVQTDMSIGYERYRVNTDGVEELIESGEWESIRKK